MFGKYRFLTGSLALFGLTWLLAACNQYADATRDIVPVEDSSLYSSITRLAEFEELLIEGNVDLALEFFDDQAVLVDINPVYSNYDDGGANYLYQLSYNHQITYRGREYIKSYLLYLAQKKFLSNHSENKNNGAEEIWNFEGSYKDTNLVVEFRATGQEGKIKLMKVTNFVQLIRPEETIRS